MLEPPGVRLWVGSPRGERKPTFTQDGDMNSFPRNAGEELGGLPVSEQRLAWEEVLSGARVRLLTLLVPWAAAA